MYERPLGRKQHWQVNVTSSGGPFGCFSWGCFRPCCSIVIFLWRQQWMESCIPSPLLLCSCLWSKRKCSLCMCLLIKITRMQARPRIYCWYNGNLNSVTQFFFMNIWLMILRRMFQLHTWKCCQTQLKLKHMGLLVSVPFLGFIFTLLLLLWVFRAAALNCWIE